MMRWKEDFHFKWEADAISLFEFNILPLSSIILFSDLIASDLTNFAGRRATTAVIDAMTMFNPCFLFVCFIVFETSSFISPEKSYNYLLEEP